MYKILVSDPLEKTGLALLRDSGHEVFELPAADKPKLAELIGDYDALVVRSGTTVTAELLAAGKKLRVVGRAGIGVDNVDIKAATERGILVVNAPTANLLSATEHTFALLLAVARNVPKADAALKGKDWDRKRFVGVELQGKSLGVIGFGRIGQRVARRARAFEMEVFAYDPFLDADVVRRYDAEPLELDELLERSDFITLHTPLTAETRNLISAERIAKIKEGAILINCGRGGVVDEQALLEALESGHLAAAGLDVFAQEPPEDFTLAAHPRVVATPHLGAQTREAQVRISTDTARMVMAALDGSLAITAVNLPFRPAGSSSEPFLRLAEKLGMLAGHLLEGAPLSVAVDLWGTEDELEVPITVAALKGALSRVLGEAVNYVNAEHLATERGIEVCRVRHSGPGNHPNLIAVRLSSDAGEIEIAGTLFHDQEPRIVRLGDHPLEFQPTGFLLVVRNDDVPGVVGRLGTSLGSAGVNIAAIHLSRQPGSGEAMAVVRLDGAPGDAVLAEIRNLVEVNSAQLVDLGTV